MQVLSGIGCWLANLDADGWAAAGTIAATIVALFLPITLSKREWRRQDRLRAEDKADTEGKRRDLHHEVCSAVDRLLAYRTALIAIIDTEPPYIIGIEAIKRIGMYAGVLREMLHLLEVRPELSDGALFSAVAAKRVGSAITRETDNLVATWGQAAPDWFSRKIRLQSLDAYADMIAARSAGVRQNFGLGESGKAAEIHTKYLPIAEAIKVSLATGAEPPNADLASTDG